mgnify:CR=1 FL=1
MCSSLEESGNRLTNRPSIVRLPFYEHILILSSDWSFGVDACRMLVSTSCVGTMCWKKGCMRKALQVITDEGCMHGPKNTRKDGWMDGWME